MRLAKTARNLTLGDLKGLMNISDDLARLNRDRFKSFSEATPTKTRARRCSPLPETPIWVGGKASTLDGDALRYAQDHLRILSGLYGVLRPMDAIQPYRLEMGSRLKTRRGTNLYQYWRDQISKALNAQGRGNGHGCLDQLRQPGVFRRSGSQGAETARG